MIVASTQLVAIMIEMGIIGGWQAAAARSGLPRTTLRRLTARGELRGTKRADGTWEFDEADLDRLREARGQATASASAITRPELEAPATVAATTSSTPSPTWTASAEAGAEEPVGQVDEVDEPPMVTPLGARWALPLPHAHVAPEPIGVDPQTRVILYGVPEPHATTTLPFPRTMTR